MYKTKFETEAKNIIERLGDNFAKLHATGAHPNLIANVMVDYHGEMMTLSSISTIKVNDALSMVVLPFEQDKKVTKAITEAINKANTGVSPIDEGNQVRISVPPIDGEKRQVYAKEAKQMSENAKISIRNARQDILKKIKNNEDHTDDEKRMHESDLQTVVDEYNSKVEEILKLKEQELLNV